MEALIITAVTLVVVIDLYLLNGRPGLKRKNEKKESANNEDGHD